MPSRSWKFRIDDIIEAIDKIGRYTNGIDFDEWQQDEKTVDAVIRNIDDFKKVANCQPL
jgi:uncharacterized protein with HEPN domain